MSTIHVTGIGLFRGQKETLSWDGETIMGSAELTARVEASLAALEQPGILDVLNRKSTPERCRLHFVQTGIRHAFDEILDVYTEVLPNPEELASRAAAWNKQGDRHWTADDVLAIEKELRWNSHHGPPHSWDEIHNNISKGMQKPPFPSPQKRAPKCLECLQVMEWFWFSSSSETWRDLCGSAGWTPICRKCKTWRRCGVAVMS